VYFLCTKGKWSKIQYSSVLSHGTKEEGGKEKNAKYKHAWEKVKVFEDDIVLEDNQAANNQLSSASVFGDGRARGHSGKSLTYALWWMYVKRGIAIEKETQSRRVFVCDQFSSARVQRRKTAVEEIAKRKNQTTNISCKDKTKMKGKDKAGKKDQSKKVATANGTEQIGKDLI
jgi:hypothetical protein